MNRRSRTLTSTLEAYLNSLQAKAILRRLQALILLWTTCLLVLGCAVPPTAGTGAPYTTQTPASNAALVVHYRKLADFGRGNTYELAFERQLIARIGNGGYFTHSVSPGRIQYLSKVYRESGALPTLGTLANTLENQYRDFEPILNLEAAAGRTYFIRWSVASSGFAKVEEVTGTTAAGELQGLRAWADR